MIEFLDWWAASNWRVVFALLVLFGTGGLIYDGIAMISTAIRHKGKD